MAKFEITWEAPEFEYREKEVSWYWISIIIAALMIAFSVWQQDFLFGLFIVIAEILFIVWGNREPRDIPFILSDEHIAVGASKMHLMREFESWSTDNNDGVWADLHFYFRSKTRSPLRVIVPVGRIEEIRVHLKPVLKEIQHDMTFIDAIEKILRF